MKNKFLIACAASAVLVMGTGGSLQADSLQLTFDGATYSLGSYYVAPYQITIGGIQYSMICDDANDNVTPGEQWNATTETMSNLTGVLYGNLGGQQGYSYSSNTQTWTVISQSQAYGEAAWLVNQIFSSSSGSTQAAYDQYALWDIFDPGFSNTSGGNLPNGEPDADLNSSQQSAVLTALEQAQTNWNVGSNNNSSLVIYTPTPQGQGEAQEFWGQYTPQAPEPMALWSLVLSLAAIAVAAGYARRAAASA